METDMNPRTLTIEDDLDRGQRLIPVKELGHEPWMPKAPGGKSYSYKTLWKWACEGGLETTGHRPKCTTRGATLRYFRHLEAKNLLKRASEA